MSSGSLQIKPGPDLLSGTEAGRDDASDIAIVEWFAKAHARPYAEAAVRTALPAGPLARSGPGIARALSLVGLSARQVPLSPAGLDPATLPAILFRKSGPPAILVGMTKNRKTFTIVDPAHNALKVDMSARQLRQEFTQSILLVTPEKSLAEARLDPGTAKGLQTGKHWLWQPVVQNWPVWVQVFVAALCLNLLNLALPIFVMNVYDRVIPNAAMVTLWTLAIGVSIALVLDFLLRLLRSATLERLAQRVDLTVASTLFRQAMAVRLTARMTGAAGMANTIRDFESVRDFFGSASFVALIDVLFIGVFGAALFLIVGPLAWVPLLAVPVVLVLAVIAQVPLAHSAVRAQSLATKRHVVLVESLLGIAAIKSLNAEPVMQREWESAIAASSSISGKARFWSGLATSGTLLVQQVVSVAIIVWGVFLVSENEITIGALIAANILAGRILAPLAVVSQTIFRSHYAFKAMHALNDLMQMPRDGDTTVKKAQTVTRGDVEFRAVTFRYPGAEHPALNDVSFKISQGERVALLGRVGSGKSTTGMLLNGLLEVEQGNILVGGHALAQYEPAELRAGIGYLTQDSELFTGTMRENLTIGHPNATDDEITQALFYAGMDQFVAANPAGLDVFLGEKGKHLSGGQRQGVALARLLLRKPKVLFLDEPTNAMDQQMEAMVTTRLGRISDSGATIIFCTHRMSLANMAERFVVLDRGRIVLDGPKDDVLAQLRHARSDGSGAV